MLKLFMLIPLLFMTTEDTYILFSFSEKQAAGDWRIVDDRVMGGLSQGNIQVNEEGYGVYSGYVTTENNGGFSSVRYRFPALETETYTQVKIKIKGDGKKYQFRIKSSSYDQHSYIYEFETSGEWEEIRIPFREMYPGWRGRKLNMPNYPGEQAEEIAFLIGNKKEQEFKLLIRKIELE